MDSHPLHPINSRYRNQKKFIADHLFYVLLYSNKEVSQQKNSLSIPSPGVNHANNSFLNSAHATLSLHQPANGDLTGTKPALLQLHQTKFNPWQVVVLIAANGSLMDPLSVPSLPNTHQNWLQLSSILSAHGFRNHHQWKRFLAKKSIARGPRITDGAGNNSSENWTIPLSHDIFKEVRKRWIARILTNHLHSRFVHACLTSQSTAFITDDELLPFLQDLQSIFPSNPIDTSVQDFQPFRLKLFHTPLTLAKDPDADIALHLEEGIASGAFPPLVPVGLWEANNPPHEDPPALQICQDNWSSPKGRHNTFT